MPQFLFAGTAAADMISLGWGIYSVQQSSRYFFLTERPLRRYPVRKDRRVLINVLSRNLIPDRQNDLLFLD